MSAAFGLFPALLLTTMTVVAQSPPIQQIPRDTKQPVTGTARLSGRVVAADANKALARATLAGTVQDDRERPIGDYTVVAFATNSAKWGYRTRFVRAARPDQNGKFLITGLPPGAYQVVAVEYLEPGEETDPARLENWRTTGSSVTTTTAKRDRSR